MTRDVTVRLGAASQVTLHGGRAVEPWTVTLADTGASALTGARVKRVERYVDGPRFMLTYGDGVADIDLGKLLAFHERHGRIGTVTGVRPPSRFGELVSSGTRGVEFSEKPSVSNGFINGGVFLFERGVFEYPSGRRGGGRRREPPRRVGQGGQLEMYPHDGYWQCMDTPRDLQHLAESWQRPRPPWKVWADGA